MGTWKHNTLELSKQQRDLKQDCERKEARDLLPNGNLPISACPSLCRNSWEWGLFCKVNFRLIVRTSNGSKDTDAPLLPSSSNMTLLYCLPGTPMGIALVLVFHLQSSVRAEQQMSMERYHHQVVTGPFEAVCQCSVTTRGEKENNIRIS